MSAIKDLKEANKVVSFTNIFNGAFKNLSGAVSNVVDAFKNGATGAEIFKTGLSGLWSVMQAHPILTTIAAISAAVAVVDLLTESFSEACEKAEASRSAYNKTASELQTIEDELTTTGEKIKELEALESPSITDENELSKLRTQNELLETQLRIKQNLAKYQLGEAANDANDVLTKQGTYFTGNFVTQSGALPMPEFTTGDVIKQTEVLQTRLNNKKQEYLDLLEKQSKVDPSDKQYKINESNLKTLEKDIDSLESDIADKLAIINEQYGSLFDSAGNIINEEHTETIERVKALIGEIEESNNESTKSTSNEAATSLENLSTKIKESTDNTSALISNLKTVQSVLSSQSTGNSISIEDFNSDELKDYTSALEYNNGALQLNAEKVNEIVKAKADEQIAINNTNKVIAQSKYLENAKQIEKYREQLKNTNLANVDARKQIQNSIDSLLEENTELLNVCTSYDLMTSSLKEATSAYQHWLNAQSASQSGDMFDGTINAINHINDTLNNSESEYFGRIGRTDYQAAVDLIIPDSVDSSDEEAVNSYLDEIYDLFTYDDSGNRNGLDIASFCQKAIDEGLMILDEASDEYKIVGQTTMKDFAEGLNLSLPLVQAMFGELEEFGAEFDWSDEAIQTLGDLAVQANESAEALRAIEGNENLKIKIDVSDLPTTTEQIVALDNTISELDKVKAKANVDASEIEYANDIIQYCLTQKQLLSQPDVMRVDTSKIEGDIANAITLLQEFQLAQNNLEIQQKIGADTTEAQNEVNSLAQEIQALNPNIKTQLELDTTSVSTILSSISSLTAEKLNIKATIDASAITGYNPESKKCDVIYNPNTDLLPQSFAEIDRYVNYIPVTSSLPSSFSSLTRYVNYVATGDTELNGTAHVSGTAMAGGDWGTAPGGKTLVGELGTEIVVDPHSGRWYTVGDIGAEFVDIPRGSIVFNHRQTESLLKNGYVAGRAAALVGGTAMVTGGIKRKYTSYSSSSGSSYSNNYSYDDDSYDDSYNDYNESSYSSESDDAEEKIEAFDWIEVAIDRIERAINKLKETAESTYKALKSKLTATADEISQVNKELELQEKAYNKYLKQANSVGLSSNLAEKVRNGSIDITEYDEETQKLIDDYKKWYEKALDCSEAIDKLHDSLASLYEDNFNNIKDNFDNRIELSNHLINSYEKDLELLETKGYLASTKYYSTSRTVEAFNMLKLSVEVEELEKSLADAMYSGEIEKCSDAWYSMQITINDTKEELVKSKIQLAEYSKLIDEIKWEHFDYIQERISNLVTETEFLIDLMNDAKLYEDNGKFTNEGLTTVALHGQNYNIHMAQADEYAKEILDINKRVANDPNDTILIERKEELLKLQQDSIKAAKSEEQAIVDLVKDGIEIELSALQKLIDNYVEALDSAKDLYDYQKKINEQSSNISSLQKQLLAYENDTSEEARAKIQKLTVELQEANDELAETQYEKYISDQKKLLDELYIEYEEVINQKLDNVEALIGNVIDTVNENVNLINETLISTTDSIGYEMTSNMQNIWNGASNALDGIISKYGDDFGSKFTAINNVLNSIHSDVSSMISRSDEQAKDTIKDASVETKIPTKSNVVLGNTTSTDNKVVANTNSSSIKIGGKINAKGALIYGYCGDQSGEYQYFGDDPIYTVLSEKNGYLEVRHHKLSSGTTGWFKKSDVKAYKTGGLVDYTGIAQVDGTPENPELMLNAEDTKNFLELRDVLREMSAQELTIGNNLGNINYSVDSPPQLIGIADVSSKLSKLRNDTIPQSNSITFGDTNISIDHVQDYADFVTQLQNDKKFEKMLLSMTVNRIMGGSSFDKYKYKWK